MPVDNKQLEAVAAAVSQELVAQVRGITGELPDQWKEKAQTLADKSLALVGKYIRKEITKEQFEDYADDLKLWAKSALANSMLDAWGKRKAIIEAAIPILIKGLVALATGGVGV